MTHIKLLLATALALSVAVTASASAAVPKFVYTSGAGFTAKTGAISQTVGSVTIKCTSAEMTGEANGASPTSKVKKVFITFKGCTTNTKVQCGVEGIIKSKELEGELSYLSQIVAGEKTAKVGIGLWATGRTTTEKTNGTFHQLSAAYKCGTEPVETRGILMGEITPLNTFVGAPDVIKHFTTEYSTATTLGEKYTIEGVLIAALNGRPEISINMSTFQQAPVIATAETFPVSGEFKIES